MRFYLLAAALVVFDQMSKAVALHFLSPGESVPVLPGIFHLTLVFNTGIAFGFFRQHPSLLFTLISLSIVFLFFLSAKSSRSGKWVQFSLALILSGALGNWIDRILHHAVIDFLDFRIWPVFNIADCAITVGVALYLFCYFLENRKTNAS